MQKRFLECGKIVNTHALKGEVRVTPWCDSPDFLLDFDTLYLEKGARALRVEQCRIQKGNVLLKLEGIDTFDAAVTLRGKMLYIDRADAPAVDGEYFIQDLLGLTISDADSGNEYGTLTDVFSTGANDVYELTTPDGAKKLFPAIRQVVLETDVEAGRMLIRPLKGLFDDAD